MRSLNLLVKFSLVLSIISLITYAVMGIEETLTGDSDYLTFFAFLLANFISIFIILVLISISFKNNMYTLGITNTLALLGNIYPWVVGSRVVSINTTLEINLLLIVVLINIFNVLLSKRKYWFRLSFEESGLCTIVINFF